MQFFLRPTQKHRPTPALPSTRALMTLPSADSDRLMRADSRRRSPVAPVALCRSLPARSTRFSLPTRIALPAAAPWQAKCHVLTPHPVALLDFSAFLCVHCFWRIAGCTECAQGHGAPGQPHPPDCKWLT